MLVQILEGSLSSPIIGEAAAYAIAHLGAANSVRLYGPSGSGQSSVSISRLHEFRLKSGYYKNATFNGLDASIQSLANEDVLVRLLVAETDRGTVDVWVDEDNVARGVITFLNRAQNQRG